MIRIFRPRRPPLILRTLGKAATRALREAYDAGERRFTFDRAIYGDAAVKEALRRAQHDKCCFCESKIAHVMYGDVEHYRPKAGHRQAREEPLIVPGYYWLAYELTNLLFCCEICNRRFKGNLFPLDDPSRRATSHHRRLSRESPRFIDPTTMDPTAYIGFRDEVAFPIGDHPTGRETIESLQLNREELLEVRRDRLYLIRGLTLRYRRLQRLREQLRERLAEPDPPTGLREQFQRVEAEIEEHFIGDSAPFAAMIRAALA
jgi:hypothetical protein